MRVLSQFPLPKAYEAELTLYDGEGQGGVRLPANPAVNGRFVTLVLLVSQSVQGRCLGAIWPILGDLALFFRCLRYNLRIVTDIAIVGPRTLATAGA